MDAPFDLGGNDAQKAPREFTLRYLIYYLLQTEFTMPPHNPCLYLHKVESLEESLQTAQAAAQETESEARQSQIICHINIAPSFFLLQNTMSPKFEMCFVRSTLKTRLEPRIKKFTPHIEFAGPRAVRQVGETTRAAACGKSQPSKRSADAVQQEQNGCV